MATNMFPFLLPRNCVKNVHINASLKTLVFICNIFLCVKFIFIVGLFRKHVLSQLIPKESDKTCPCLFFHKRYAITPCCAGSETNCVWEKTLTEHNNALIFNIEIKFVLNGGNLKHKAFSYYYQVINKEN